MVQPSASPSGRRWLTIDEALVLAQGGGDFREAGVGLADGGGGVESGGGRSLIVVASCVPGRFAALGVAEAAGLP